MHFLLKILISLLFWISILALIVGLIKPNIIIRWGTKRTRMWVLKTYGSSMILFFILIALVVLISPRPESKKPWKERNIAIPMFSVLEEDTYDASDKTQVKLKILVFEEITNEGLKILLNRLYENTKARKGFQYHDNPTNIYIYAYTSKEDAEEGSEWIAMLGKNYDDTKTIILNEIQFSQLKSKTKE